MYTFLMFNKTSKNIDTDPKKIEELLTRGVEDVFVKESLEKKLKSGKQLRVKLGFDPTGSKIHIGRAIVLRKLRAFQDLGHKVVFIVGDFTAKIGDPSDKLEKRPMLTDEKIKENLKNYKDQIGKIIDLSKAEFHYNSKWLSKLTFSQTVELAETFSVSQMTSRRNFKDRLDRGDEVSLREFLYPLMQGYDSVAIKADIELGGFDQLFNLKAGRVVQKYYNQEQQDVLTISMLEGTDGRKMSTSWGNVINISDEPNDMYGKVMSVRDDLVIKYFLLCTDLSKEEINILEKDLNSKPKETKMRLAREIVTIYHSKELAEKAEKNFEETFSKGGVPEDVKEVVIGEAKQLVDILLENKLIESKSEFKRLVKENAIKFNDEVVVDVDFKLNKGGIVKAGKRRFLKINI